MFSYILAKLGISPRVKTPSDTDIGPSTPACIHPETKDFGEGIRFCASCKSVQRLEKRRIPERGQDPWEWRTLPREEALEILKDLQLRQQS